MHCRQTNSHLSKNRRPAPKLHSAFLHRCFLSIIGFRSHAETIFMVEEFAFDNTEERRKNSQNGTGWIEVIAGSMFSGKSEELIRRLNRARIARQKVQVFKPEIDARYSVEEIASHSGQKHGSMPVITTAEMMAADPAGNAGRRHRRRAILRHGDRSTPSTSSPQTANASSSPASTRTTPASPFEPMPQLLSIAEFITKTHAICVKCGAPPTTRSEPSNPKPASRSVPATNTRPAAANASSPTPTPRRSTIDLRREICLIRGRGERSV